MRGKRYFTELVVFGFLGEVTDGSQRLYPERDVPLNVTLDDDPVFRQRILDTQETGTG